MQYPHKAACCPQRTAITEHARCRSTTAIDGVVQRSQRQYFTGLNPPGPLLRRDGGGNGLRAQGNHGPTMRIQCWWAQIVNQTPAAGLTTGLIDYMVNAWPQIRTRFQHPLAHWRYRLTYHLLGLMTGDQCRQAAYAGAIRRRVRHETVASSGSGQPRTWRSLWANSPWRR
jgi:hypothetical protein